MRPVDLEVLLLLEEGRSLTSKDIANRISSPLTTVSQSLRNLVRQGHVEQDHTSVRRRFVAAFAYRATLSKAAETSTSSRRSAVSPS